MTFRAPQKDFNVPFIEDNANELLAALQNNFLEFTRTFDQIKDYCKSLTYLGQNEYNKKKNEIQTKIKDLPNKCKNLNNIIIQINNMEIKDSVLNKKVRDQIKIVNERFLPKQNEVPKILNEILEKEKQVSRRMGLNESDLDQSFISQAHKQSQFDRFRESKIVLDEVMDNVEYLNKRHEQLEEIKKVASQVKDISNAMTKEVAKSGEDINRLENIIVDAKENTQKAENEINIAEKETRGMTRKVLCLVAIICFIVISIVILMIFIMK